jgi:hypothetical protein
VRGEQVGFRRDLRSRHAAVQVGAHIVGLGWQGIVGVAANVEVVVVVRESLTRHDGRVARNVGELAVRDGNLLDVLG